MIIIAELISHDIISNPTLIHFTLSHINGCLPSVTSHCQLHHSHSHQSSHIVHHTGYTVITSRTAISHLTQSTTPAKAAPSSPLTHPSVISNHQQHSLRLYCYHQTHSHFTESTSPMKVTPSSPLTQTLLYY